MPHTLTICTQIRELPSPQQLMARNLRQKFSATGLCGYRGVVLVSDSVSTSPQLSANIRKRSAAFWGGHGITAWGNTSDEVEANSLWIIETAAAYIAEHGKAAPFGAPLSGYEPLLEAERHAKAATLAPVIRALVSRERVQVGSFSDDEAVLDFLASEEHARLAALGTACPDPLLRTRVKPLVLDMPADAGVEESIARLKELHEQYRADYQAYYRRYATADSV